MSIFPYCSTTGWIKRFMSSILDTSALVAMERLVPIFQTTSAAASAEETWLTTMFFPSLQRAGAVARPIPRKAPVTSVTLPLRLAEIFDIELLFQCEDTWN